MFAAAQAARSRRLATLALLVGVTAVVSGSAAAQPNATPGPAVVPRNDVAAIWNNFGFDARPFATYDAIARYLREEGYRVTRFQSPWGPNAGPGSATLANFVWMAAHASVIVIDTHGFDPTVASRDCPHAKGLFRSYGKTHPLPDEPIVCPKPPAGTPEPPDEPSVLAPSGPAMLVERETGIATLAEAYTRYLKQGFEPQWLEPIVGSPSEGRLYGLMLTQAGISHFFHGRNIGLIVANACKSMSFAPQFDALSYFGYRSTACTPETPTDDATLFNRLFGEHGVPLRSTVAAFGAGGFLPDRFDNASREPVVLSPAVESVSPRQGTRVAAGTTTRAEVRFDARMDTSHGDAVVEASGCGATVVDPSWSGDGSTLSFGLRVPKHPQGGELTARVLHAAAIADGGDGENAQLDGNAQPRGDSGLVPNRDDYVWTLSCGTTPTSAYQITVTDTGTYSQHDVLLGKPAGSSEVHWNAKVVLTFPEGKGKQTLRTSATFSANGSYQAQGPDPSENFSCQISGTPAAQNAWVLQLVRPLETSGVNGSQGWPQSDQIDVVTGEPAPAPLTSGTGGGDVHLSGGPKCTLHNDGTFLQTLGASDDHDADWLAAAVPFTVTGTQVHAAGGHISKHYAVHDAIRNTNEVNTITLDRTITVSES